MTFAMIDAKDSEIIEVSSYSMYGRPKTKYNMEIIHKATVEYLKELSKLQLMIRKKYEHLLKPEKDDEEKLGWLELDSFEMELELKHGSYYSHNTFYT